jgi:quinoprotein glucose dehydrogenase
MSSVCRALVVAGVIAFGTVWSAAEESPARSTLPEYQVIPAANPDELTPALAGDAATHRTWARSNADDANTRFSALSQINRNTVGDLRIAWVYLADDGTGNLQCNPLVVDDVVYVPTPGEHVVAINGASGEEVWRFKGEGRPAFRGLTYWPGDATHAARVLVSIGKDLWALDSKTGKPIATFGEGGKVPAGESRVAGAVFERVFILPGYAKDVFGFDVATGEKLWTFHTIPGPGEFGFDTWDGQETGANTWGGMALDAQRGIAYVATGSPKPDFLGMGHKGENLFADCVIALDARTGERRWHFQEIRHDIWDLDIPAAPNLVTVSHAGKRVDAVAQVTKLGNTLLLDRATGKPLHPVRLRRAPESPLPGEQTATYQPAIELPEPFSRQEFSKADITDRNDDARAYVEQRIANARMGWFEAFEENRPTVFYGVHGGAEWTGAAFDPTSGKLYVSANELPWMITVYRSEEAPEDLNAPPTAGRQVYEKSCMECHGPKRQGTGTAPPLHGLARRTNDAEVLALLDTGRNLMPRAENLSDQDKRGLLDYIFLRDREEAAVKPVPDAEPRYTFTGYHKLLDQDGYPGSKPPWGTLNCIDLNTGKIAWKVPLGRYPDLAFWGETDTGAENFGGAMVTAGGLVFCAGTPDRKLRAFDADTGETLWEGELPWGGYAPPATYEVDGRQFIIIAATGGGKLGGPEGNAWVAFALPED